MANPPLGTGADLACGASGRRVYLVGSIPGKLGSRAFLVGRVERHGANVPIAGMSRRTRRGFSARGPRSRLNLPRKGLADVLDAPRKDSTWTVHPRTRLFVSPRRLF